MTREEFDTAMAGVHADAIIEMVKQDTGREIKAGHRADVLAQAYQVFLDGQKPAPEKASALSEDAFSAPAEPAPMSPEPVPVALSGDLEYELRSRTGGSYWLNFGDGKPALCVPSAWKKVGRLTAKQLEHVESKRLHVQRRIAK